VAPPAALVVLGPTASGKSQLALGLAARLPVEIISMDSALVYRGMDIGTAKPTVAERACARHHLIDLVDPDQAYSAGRWLEDALRAAQEILGRGKLPVFVGGTMLYYRALVQGLDALPQADAAVRRQIAEEAGQRGWAALHADLQRVDPASAARIKPGDSQRIQRALEVWRVTGKPLSSLHGATSPQLPFQVRACARVPAREALHASIEMRFDAMLREGLVEELQTLRRAFRLTPEMPSMRAVGYRQVWDYLEGALSHQEMRSRAIAATRQLAKRQMTWLRSFPGLLRLDAGGGEDLAVSLQLLLDVGAEALGRARL
jgi:tRNA dimethylallyltransferase